MEPAIYGSDWTDQENRLAVPRYFEMLQKSLVGQKFSKIEVYRDLGSRTGRTVKSIERKFTNISAVMHELGLPIVTGLKPSGNYQGSLIEAVSEQLSSMEIPIEATEQPTAGSLSLTAISTTVPAGFKANAEAAGAMTRLIRKFNPAERDERNRELGKLGEQLVFDHECRRLIGAGQADLAKRVRWVSRDDGDGAGYDIRSFALDGKERLLEVKATNGSSTTPFYLSENEISLSEERHDAFRLVRVYQALTEPAAYVARPPLDDYFRLKPISFRAYVR